jgi:hypothetical protein
VAVFENKLDGSRGLLTLRAERSTLGANRTVEEMILTSVSPRVMSHTFSGG